MMDTKWWQKLTLPLARWVNKKGLEHFVMEKANNDLIKSLNDLRFSVEIFNFNTR